MSITAEELFAGTVGQRHESARFDLLDANRNLLGELMVDRGRSPSIRNDVNSTIMRTLDGIRVPARPLSDQDPAHFYAEDLDTLTMRIRPSWLLGTGDEYPLGLFEFGDDSAEVWSWGEPREVTGVDLNVELDQDLAESVSYGKSLNVGVALGEECDRAGFDATVRSIDSTSITFGEPVAWAAGRDTHLTVLQSLCALAGFLPPYFDNDGILTCRAAGGFSSAEFTYGFGVGAVLNGSIFRSNDLLEAPNRYVVVDSSATESPITGLFDVPDAAPHSFANTARRRTRTLQLQGLADSAAADAAAAAAYAADSETYTWLQFNTPVDPRHDTFNVLSFDGVNYRQQAWSIECRAGGVMSHDCRGTYE